MKWKKSIAIFSALCMAVLISTGASGVPNNKVANSMIKIHRNATSTYVNGYTVSQIKSAYGIDKLAKDGAGETIAIVDAYGDPNIKSDLKAFDSQFNLPDADLEIDYPNGKPATDAGWALETALDVEWAHAIAPEAKIELVAAYSASTKNLLNAVNYANNHGAQVVSMSWGSDESSSLTQYDSYFKNSGTVYVASAGDNGSEVCWPAASANVISVGGTTLSIDSNGNRTSETAWDESGGGINSYVSEPSWQTKMNISSSSDRATPDVSFDADPATGVAVYDSVRYNGTSGWWEIGGTSFSAPAWAGLIAIGDNYSPISSANELLYKLAGETSYSNPQVNYYDVTSGSNGNSAGQGYDLVTGLGSPVADKLVPKL